MSASVYLKDCVVPLALLPLKDMIFKDIYGAKYMQKVETEELLFKTKAALIP